MAAAAYMSCSRIYNDYDGVQHDYTRKQGLVWQQVFLPDIAPAEWADREILWNAVEEAEKTKDSRLAREFVAALPVELGRGQWIALLTEFIQTNFVAEGMCADVCIHDTDGHNPHAHIMLTVRSLTREGSWGWGQSDFSESRTPSHFDGLLAQFSVLFCHLPSLHKGRTVSMIWA